MLSFLMRRIIFTSLGVITLIAVIAFAWVGAGERLFLFLNRFKTVRLETLPVRPLSAYNGREGTYYAGAFFIGKEEMPTSKMSDWTPFPLTVRGDRGQLFLFTGGKSFRFGPLLATTRDDVGRVVFAFAPDPEDKASFTIERSLFSWPTPFEVNFMTGGPVPSWRRHLTYRLLWQKRSGEQLEMVWCYRQDFMPSGGWKEVWPSAVAGLVRVDIRP
ncbi:MAG TPA: hypothetical protein VFU37_14880 [Pyrinomonadaceae bacterium]|nr:hypothetical protein [Pyrinomonadaceae bacterium]